ncbi:uncharacterized protein LOC132276155 [Cornus florida]|uniref:uncharacterized protein LOC132276155 n=1 Tax=Cornus florida TaxID=4283 RepID=UPI00289C8B4E|nr:uncharacterized protein LOC132276155 [Cornus florida]XP_059633425.1 uncharacterized protein LOC132276155 [Cornus florida]XP_059633426.1 uncharacterized protein LOC132276155 [Cornus florida]XP_059633427.1 uncharacterized protein LOC132276155 [Cornus florida]XP_059633428.1 uncharacterized protein LOC132276155 [Cornus florida]XP_059633429.1 uncharacterized protein LOC132276155 [Cornus florida]XP_059633430.1 uncharacterized protein LOC132276155 [Cornus florida]XP_059633431.1 uncharacterized p
MAKGRGKKLRDMGQLVSNPNESKKIKKKFSKRKKKTSKIYDASITTGLSSTSISSPTTASGTLVAPVSIHTTTNENEVVTQGRKEEEENSESSISGFIFMCNNKTKPECYQYRVFGLPKGKLEVVKKIKPGMKLFLFDFDLKLLYGVYKATSTGELGLETAAFGGRFPAQVKFKIFKDCLPVPESALRLGIGDIYQGRSKFRQELSRRQVETLISFFRPITVPLQASVAPPLPNLAPQHSFVAPVVEERFQLPTRLPASASPLPNLGPPCSFAAPVMEERFQPRTATRLPPPQEPYISGVHHIDASPAFDPRSVQGAPPPLYDYYGSAAYVAHFQPPVESRYVVPPHNVDPYHSGARSQPSVESHHVVQQVVPPRNVDPYYLAARSQPRVESHHVVQQVVPPRNVDPYYLAAHSQPPVESHHVVQQVVPPRNVDSYHLAGVHEPYFPENPVLSTQDPHKRYVVAPDMVPRDQFVGHGSEYHMSLLLGEKETISHPECVVDYHNQHLPPTVSSYATLQARALPQSYAPLIPSNAPAGLSSSYQAYYTVPAATDTSRVYVDPHQTPLSGETNFVGANVPVSSLYSFAGAAPTYQ